MEMIEGKKVNSKSGCLMFSAWNAYDYLKLKYMKF